MLYFGYTFIMVFLVFLLTGKYNYMHLYAITRQLKYFKLLYKYSKINISLNIQMKKFINYGEYRPTQIC